LSLPLKYQLSEEDELGVKSKKKKKMSEVLVPEVEFMHRDKIMQESEGPNPEIFQAFQKDTLQEVLLIYFRILKLEDNTKLIHVVLEGLASFSHLLNSRIIIDLLETLKKIMQEKTLTLESTLQCVLASLRLIHLVSAIISIDEGIFITKLYALRFDLIKVQNHKFIPDFLECIDVCLNL
jgi:singapore isolate B (sub-type 7) whole genome shotgun sequence assembly, scaffold_5